MVERQCTPFLFFSAVCECECILSRIGLMNSDQGQDSMMGQHLRPDSYHIIAISAYHYRSNPPLVFKLKFGPCSFLVHGRSHQDIPIDSEPFFFFFCHHDRKAREIVQNASTRHMTPELLFHACCDITSGMTFHVPCCPLFYDVVSCFDRLSWCFRRDRYVSDPSGVKRHDGMTIDLSMTGEVPISVPEGLPSQTQFPQVRVRARMQRNVPPFQLGLVPNSRHEITRSGVFVSHCVLP